jgi:hypothetical protein
VQLFLEENLQGLTFETVLKETIIISGVTQKKTSQSSRSLDLIQEVFQCRAKFDLLSETLEHSHVTRAVLPGKLAVTADLPVRPHERSIYVVKNSGVLFCDWGTR